MAKANNLEGKKLTDSQQKTQSAFLAVTLITGQCHAILNTQFTAPSKKPVWFDDLNTKLQAAKDCASEWINDLAPAVSASIPAKVIDYGTTFSACADQIYDLYNKDPNALGVDNKTVIQAKEVMTILSQQVASIRQDVSTTQDKLKTWGEKMQKAHDNLKNGAVSIQNTMTDLQTDIEHMDSAIKEYQDAIEGYNKALLAAELAVGIGIFLLVAGVVLCIATAGTAAVVAGGVAAVGAASIIAGAVTWGVTQAKINAAYADIAEERKEKTDDQQQIISLKALALSTDSAVTSMEASLTALSDFEVTWALYGDELDAVVKKLQLGASMKSIIAEKVMTEAALNEWDDAVELSKLLAGATISVDAKALDIGAKAA